MTRRELVRAVPIAIVLGAGMSLHAATPKLVSATYLGTPGHDDLQDAAIAADGTIIVVGNTDQPLTKLPEGVKSVVLGQPVEGTWYRCGLLATFTADGTKMLACVQFARGLAFLTSVALGKEGIYVGGYGTEKLADLLKPFGGPLTDFKTARDTSPPNPLPDRVDVPKQSLIEDPSNKPGPEDVCTIKSRHHGVKGGVPFVARLNPELTTLTAGTLLEGQHYGWNVAMPLYEEEWTPTAIAPLPGGDVAVVHDGAAPVSHYYAPDYLSRLSPDLKSRAWKLDLFHPEIGSIEKIHQRGEKYKGWKFPILGQTRTLRMRGDGKGSVYVGGWGVSMTSKEPWWCPFLWKFSGDGKIVWQAYTCDPMSGKGDRVNGLVADSAIRSMALDDEGALLVSGISDGGNTVLRQDPHDYNLGAPKMKGGFSGMKGRTLYVGHFMRLDAKTADLLAGTGFGSYGDRRYQATWAVDVAGLPGKRILAVGRHGLNHPSTPDAWFTQQADKGMFIRVMSEDCKQLFSTNVPDAIPYTVARKGARCVVVGIAESDRAPTQDALFGQHAGGLDAYLLVADFPE